MKLKIKLLVNLLTVSIVTGLVVAILSVVMASNAIEKQVFDQLESLREAKKTSIERYLDDINNQILSLASSNEVMNALTDFNDASAIYMTSRGVDDSDMAEKRAQLANYYDREFLTRFAAGNSPNFTSGADYVERLSDVGVVLQLDYIAENPEPVGSKHLLDGVDKYKGYGKQHVLYHSFFRDYLERFKYYDLFLVDAWSGDVIYSVFKEVDFGTSLKDGAFSNTGIGQAYNAALNATDMSQANFIDFDQYAPSYNAPAGFVSAPIFVDDEVAGVLIFQFPVVQLNKIMTERAGLGETGETYLVGPDRLMRSDTNRDSEHHSLAASFADKEAGRVDTTAVEASLSGRSGSEVITSYSGDRVLSAYAPLQRHGLSWSIIAEMDVDEAMAAIRSLQLGAVLVVLGCAIVIVPLGIVISNSITRPLGGEPLDMVAIAKSVADKDLTVEFSSKASSNTIYGAMRDMSANLRDIIAGLADSSHRLASAADQSSSTSKQTLDAVEQQRSGTDQVATAITEMSATVQEIANNTAETSRYSADAQQLVNQGTDRMEQTLQTVAGLVQQGEQTSQAISSLHDESQKIGAVLDVIQSIAEQTNLLALNAAIEAARAGEHGRGFAVVADEVRSLAQKTQGSASDIQQMVESIQSGAKRAIDSMEANQRQVMQTSQYTEQAKHSFDEIREAVTKISDMAAQIATATEQQTVVASEVDSNIVAITELAEQTYQGAQEINASSSEVAEAAEELSGIVGQFKV
ncbi:methyl-accepting chemotaxis protein [Reinekea marinisedimentorum]|uniref:Methyl-accepting chemotaxis protein n=1 Tax=Reinekea marinisedimentorum TaxID=230495 RepID=A0A4R3I525_9GAMM|nr:methyl-accepting chemotaxis protein [Reinekea marinisedimentorum]TCS40195.1 methyl-accepting chemotaxis protein [Reinekea marinisedimentorum]